MTEDWRWGAGGGNGGSVSLCVAVTGEMMDMSIGAFSLIVVVDVKHDTRAFTLLCNLQRPCMLMILLLL